MPSDAATTSPSSIAVRRSPTGSPTVEHVHGDRDGGLDAAARPHVGRRRSTRAATSRAWCATPRGCLRGPGRGTYAFISTLSVYPDDAPGGLQRGDPDPSAAVPRHRGGHGRVVRATEGRVRARGARTRSPAGAWSSGPATSWGRTTRRTGSRSGCGAPPRGGTDAGARTPGPAAAGRRRPRPGRVHARSRGGRHGGRLRRGRDRGSRSRGARVWRRWWTSPTPGPS